MPNIVVYLSTKDEAALRDEGHDPKKWVREAVKRALSERGDGRQATERTQNDLPKADRPHLGGQLPQPRSESDDHFKPDPKPTRAEKKGRR